MSQREFKQASSSTTKNPPSRISGAVDKIQNTFIYCVKAIIRLIYIYSTDLNRLTRSVNLIQLDSPLIRTIDLFIDFTIKS